MAIESIGPIETPRARDFAAPAWHRGVVAALWHGRSVRARLVIIFVVIDIVAVLVAGTVTILRARGATQVEVQASMTLAGLLVEEAVSLVPQDAPPDQILTNLPLQLRFLRHVRIAVTDNAGTSVGEPARTARGDERADAPAWFAALIAPAAQRREVPVVVKGRRIGAVVVQGEPSDEIAEVWQNTLALGAVAAGLNVLVVAILYVIFGRVLNPLTALAVGLSDLQRRHYTVRLAPPRQRELADIVERFNELAEALETVRAENVRLGQRLITAQDDERRRTARDLHDEVGPCLFGLKANAGSIASAIGKLPAADGQAVTDRVHDMLAIIERLQVINRSLLNRLRPMALGHVPLRDIIADVVDRARQHANVSMAFDCTGLARSYGEAIDLTVYRCVQEGLTNALRHATPTTVRVALAETHDRELTLTVCDDGCGIAPGTPKGFGLTGMEERVQALGGRFAIDSSPHCGTGIKIVMPLTDTRDAAAGQTP